MGGGWNWGHVLLFAESLLVIIFLKSFILFSVYISLAVEESAVTTRAGEALVNMPAMQQVEGITTLQ